MKNHKRENHKIVREVYTVVLVPLISGPSLLSHIILMSVYTEVKSIHFFCEYSSSQWFFEAIIDISYYQLKRYILYFFTFLYIENSFNAFPFAAYYFKIYFFVFTGTNS